MNGEKNREAVSSQPLGIIGGTGRGGSLFAASLAAADRLAFVIALIDTNDQLQGIIEAQHAEIETLNKRIKDHAQEAGYLRRCLSSAQRRRAY